VTDPHFARTLIHTIDVASPETERDGGELITSYGDTVAVQARFVPFTERWSSRRNSWDIKRQHRLLLRSDADVSVRDQVTNIRITSSGIVIDAGPFTVTQVLAMGDGKGLHHLEAEMERSG